MSKSDKRSSTEDGAGQVGGLFKGLGDLISRLGEMAEKGEGMNKSFETDGKASSGKPFKAVYGFSVKLGRGGEGMRVEPFGTVHKATPGAEPGPEIPVAREPMIDVFDETDGFHIVAEMPGVAKKDVKIEVSGKTLTLTAEAKDRKYEKVIELPRTFKKDAASVSCNNGMVEIHLK